MKQSHLLSNGNNALLLFCLVNAKSSFALTSSVTNHQLFCSIVDSARHFCMQHVSIGIFVEQMIAQQSCQTLGQLLD